MGQFPARANSHDEADHDIFLSYSRTDTDLMLRVKDELETAGFRVWIDQTELDPGTHSWTSAIETAIDTCGCVVVVLSPTAKKSQWVREEMDYARSQDKKIFGALAKGKPNNALPFGYSTLQYVDLTNETNFDAEMHKLVAAIAKYLELGPLPAVDDLVDDMNDLAPPPLVTAPAQPTPPTPTLPTIGETLPFTAFNPLNWLKILWWVFMDAAHYEKARHRYAAAWLGSTLVWLPLFLLVAAGTIDTLNLDFSQVPVGSSGLKWDHPTILGALLSGILAAWLVTWGMIAVNSNQAVAVVVPMMVAMTLTGIIGIVASAGGSGVALVALVVVISAAAMLIGVVTDGTPRGVAVGVVLGVVGGVAASVLGALMVALTFIALYTLWHIEFGEAWSPRKGKPLVLAIGAVIIGGVVGGLLMSLGEANDSRLHRAILGVVVGAMYGVIISIFHQVAHGVVMRGVAVLQHDQRRHDTSVLSIATFGLMILAHAVLVWYGMLGGADILP